MAETKVGSNETSTTVQVESLGLEETKEKDLESQESEPKADVKVESSETSKAVEDEETKEKDLESQKRKPKSEKKDGEKKNKNGKSKDGKECEKQAAKTDVKEDFLFTAAICSTWIPTVVGDQKQKIYLKAGMTCLIKKIMF